MKNETIPIEGMSCNHCVSSITSALTSLAGVETVAVSLEEKQAVITYDETAMTHATITDVIEDLGFEVTN